MHVYWVLEQVANQTDETKVSIAIGDHILRGNAYDNSVNDDLASVSIAIGDHKLYFWGVSAQLLDEDNTQVSIAIGGKKGGISGRSS